MHRRIAVTACVLAVLVAAPVRASTIQTFVLSNEGSNGLVSHLLAAGYGNLNLYQTLQQIVTDTNPSVAGILTPAFLNTLRNDPASSAIFTTQLMNVNPGAQSIGISTDGTVQVVSVFGSTYYGQAGTDTLLSNISGVGDALFTHSTGAQPLTSWQSGGNTYDVFAIAWTPAAPTATPEPSTLALLSLGALALAGRLLWQSRQRRRQTHGQIAHTG